MKQSLFEIWQELKSLQQRFDDELEATGGDVTEGTAAADLEAEIKKYEWAQASKVDAYCGMMANIEHDAEATRQALARLERRKQILENQYERLKGFAKMSMQAQGVTKVTGVVHGGLKIYNNTNVPIELQVADPEKWPAEFVRVEKSLEKKKIGDALKAGSAALDGFAKFGERGTHVRVI